MNNTLCCGCLCFGRDLQIIKENWDKQQFFQLINETPLSSSDDSAILLCWQCRGLLRKFSKFRHQVKTSYKILTDYNDQSKNLSDLQRKSNLQVNHVYSIDYRPDVDLIEPINHVEVEIEWQNDVKDKGLEIKQEIELQEYGDDRSDSEEVIKVVKKRGRPKKLVVKNEKSNKKKKLNLQEEDESVYKVIVLTQEEIDGERLSLASNSAFQDALFKCDRCIVTFANKDDLNDHVVNKHDSKSNNHKCEICECTFSNEISFNYHMKKHTVRYQCIFCTERLGSKHAANKHFGNHHSGFSNIEEYENNKEALLIDEQNAVDDISNNQCFPCEFCDKVFKWKTSLNKHSETHRIQTGLKRKPYCEPCRLTFTSTANLQKHVKTSSKHQIQLRLRKLKESLSEVETNPDKRQACIDEIKNNVNSSLTKYPCPHCDKKFQWKGNLLRHIQSHVARSSGQLVCEPCDRTFSSIATYTQHMKISKKHVTEHDFKYMCSDCGKKFPNKTLLKDHVDWEHLKNFVHKCSVCEKVFKSHTSLYLHKKVVHRSDSGDHLCDHCGKAFPNHAKLRTHITAMHTTEQPYKCKLCTASFSWHSCLSRHVKVVHHKMKLKKKKRLKDGENE